MERKTEIEVDEYYHIYNRGVERRNIFLDKSDRERFLRLLHIANSHKPFVFRLVRGLPLDKIDVGKKKVAIIAYVLMPNHFHILITEVKEGGISKFLQKLTTAYVMYYNKKYKRTGSLFEGKFKAQHLSYDVYLKYIFSYIHLNPIKLIQSDWKEKGIRDIEKVKKFLTNYKYSSFLDYLDIKRVQNKIFDKKYFPEYFPNKKSFVTEILDWINYK